MTHPARILGLLLLAASIALAAGCATGPDDSPNLFVLDNANQAAPAPTAAAAGASTLVVAPVNTASYLDQGGIVYQTAPYRVVVANNNRWASPLSAELTDGLYNVLAERLPGMNILRSKPANHAPALMLITRVDEFMGHYDGSAHVSGQWRLLDASGEQIAGAPFDARVPLNKDGYPALVGSLSEGWRQVALQMAPKIQAAAPMLDDRSK